MNSLHIFQVAAKCILPLTLRYSYFADVVEILRSIDLKSFNWNLLQQWFTYLDWYGCKIFMHSNPLKLVQSSNIINFTLYRNLDFESFQSTGDTCIQMIQIQFQIEHTVP